MWTAKSCRRFRRRFAEVGGVTDGVVGGVYDDTNVVGFDGAAAAVIAVISKGISLREILTALRPAIVAKALCSGIGAPDRKTAIELREALLLPK
jgi:hypothetical protein